jgi:hypothetical protein
MGSTCRFPNGSRARPAPRSACLFTRRRVDYASRMPAGLLSGKSVHHVPACWHHNRENAAPVTENGRIRAICGRRRRTEVFHGRRNGEMSEHGAQDCHRNRCGSRQLQFRAGAFLHGSIARFVGSSMSGSPRTHGFATPTLSSRHPHAGSGPSSWRHFENRTRLHTIRIGAPVEQVKWKEPEGTEPGRIPGVGLRPAHFAHIRSEFMAEFEHACADKKIRLYVLPPKSPKMNGAVERCNRQLALRVLCRLRPSPKRRSD